MNSDIIISVIITILSCTIIGLLLKIRALSIEKKYYKNYYDQMESQERMFSGFIENPLQERPTFVAPQIIKSGEKNNGFLR